MGSGQQCCYKGGVLLVGPKSGGTVDLVAPTDDVSLATGEHFIEDVLPAIHCCKGDHQDLTCHLYYERRPSSKGQSCDPPPPGKLSSTISNKI